MMVGGHSHVPAALPWERTVGTHRTGDWVGSRPVLEVFKKDHTARSQVTILNELSGLHTHVYVCVYLTEDCHGTNFLCKYA
jgi:hypothetical protein